MTRRDVAWRLGGVFAIALSGCTSLLHRHVLETSRAGPATAAEFVLGLASFVLAGAGILLLIQGARLRDSWIADLERRDHARQRARPPVSDEQASLNLIAADPFALPGGRAAIAMFLADRTIRAAADAHRHPAYPPDKVKTGQNL